MAKVEIEESELAALHRVSKFTESALANPKTRASLLTIQKVLNPEAVIPEIDATAQVMSVVKELKDEMAADRKARDEERAKDDDARRTNGLQAKMMAGQKLLADHGYEAEGVKKIEELMLAEGISSYAAGMAYFERLNPPSQPADSSRTSRFGDLSGNADIQSADFKELWDSQGQSENWLQKSLAESRQQFRN